MYTVHTRKQTNENNNNTNGVFCCLLLIFFFVRHTQWATALLMCYYCIVFALSFHSLWNELYIGKCVYYIHIALLFAVMSKLNETFHNILTYDKIHHHDICLSFFIQTVLSECVSLLSGFVKMLYDISSGKKTICCTLEFSGEWERYICLFWFYRDLN